MILFVHTCVYNPPSFSVDTCVYSLVWFYSKKPFGVSYFYYCLALVS